MKQTNSLNSNTYMQPLYDFFKTLEDKRKELAKLKLSYGKLTGNTSDYEREIYICPNPNCEASRQWKKYNAWKKHADKDHAQSPFNYPLIIRIGLDTVTNTPSISLVPGTQENTSRKRVCVQTNHGADNDIYVPKQNTNIDYLCHRDNVDVKPSFSPYFDPSHQTTSVAKLEKDIRILEQEIEKMNQYKDELINRIVLAAETKGLPNSLILSQLSTAAAACTDNHDHETERRSSGDEMPNYIPPSPNESTITKLRAINTEHFAQRLFT